MSFGDLPLVRELRQVFTGGEQPPDRYVGGFGAFLFAALLLAVGLGLLVSVVELWPAVDESTAAQAAHEEVAALFFGAVHVTVDKATGLIVLVMIMGALGGFIHAATSFVTYLGNRELKISWMWWYWLRIPMGAAMALVFYFALRAGLIGVQGDSQTVNQAGAATLAFVAGLFSKQAVDKLRELFDTLLPTDGDDERGDKLDDSRPVIKRLEPDHVDLGQAVEVKIHGERFKDGARVRLSHDLVDADFVNSRELRCKLRDRDVDSKGALRIAVVNAAPRDAQSNVKVLHIK